MKIDGRVGSIDAIARPERINSGAGAHAYAAHRERMPPAVDCLDVPNLKEYVGIDWFGDDVFTAFTGSIPNDPGNPPPTDHGAIWSSRIRW